MVVLEGQALSAQVALAGFPKGENAPPTQNTRSVQLDKSLFVRLYRPFVFLEDRHANFPIRCRVGSRQALRQHKIFTRHSSAF